MIECFLDQILCLLESFKKKTFAKFTYEQHVYKQAEFMN
jgi:hypothetical protein